MNVRHAVTWPLRVRDRLRRVRLVVLAHVGAVLVRSRVRVRIDPGVRVGRGVVVRVRPRTSTTVVVRSGSRLGDGVRLVLGGGTLWLGHGVHVRAGCVIDLRGGAVTCDGPNLVSWGVAIRSAHEVRLAPKAYVTEYAVVDDTTSAGEQGTGRGVLVGEDAWICPRSVLRSGARVGDHSIVGPNSVVRGDVPAGALASGDPARVVRDLGLPWLGDAAG